MMNIMKHYATRQSRNDKNYDASRSYDSISFKSTVAVQWEDGRPWTYGTVVGRGDQNHNNRSYMTRISKTGQIVTKNSKHIKAAHIKDKQYLQDQIKQKYNRPFE